MTEKNEAPKRSRRHHQTKKYKKVWEERHSMERNNMVESKKHPAAETRILSQ
jgi:hypothetical protein